MDLTAVVAAIGAISGLASLLTLVLAVGRRLGEIGTRLNALWEAGISERLARIEARFDALWEAGLPSRLSALEAQVGNLGVKVDAIWRLFVERPLAERGGPVQQASARRLTEEARKMLPDDLKDIIKGIVADTPVEKRDLGEFGFRITARVGVERLVQLAQDSDTALDEFLAIAAVYADEVARGEAG